MSILSFSQRLVLLAGVCAIFAIILLAGIARQYQKESRDLKELIALREEKAKLQGEIETSKKEKGDLAGQVQAAKKEGEAKLEAAKKDLDAAKKDTEDKLAAAKKEREAAEGALQEEKKKVEARAAKAEADAGGLKKNLEALAAEDAKVKEELSAHQKDRSFFQGEVKGLRAEVEGIWEEAMKMRGTGDETAKASIEAASAIIAEVGVRLDRTDAALQGGQEKLDAAIARSQAIEEKVAALTESVDAAKEALAAIGAGQEAATARYADLAKQVDAIAAVLVKEERPKVARAEIVPAVAPAGASGEKVAAGEKKASGPAAPPPDDPTASLLKVAREVLGDAKAAAPTPSPSKSIEEKGRRLAELNGGAKLPKIEGKVSDVQAGIIIIAAGAKDGVVKDGVFEVRRNGAAIARAKVTRVTDGLSGAILLPGDETKDIQVGDLAVFVGR
jgi:hypothetical protein